jgi:hypothetical protein
LRETQDFCLILCPSYNSSDPVLRSLGGWNQHVYKVLQGRSEFEATGRMKGWDRWADLPKIKVRTLTRGSPKPLIGTEGSDAYRWRESALIRLSDLGHGETKRDTRTISRDGETMTIQDRSTTPHGVVFATLVMHRQH